MDGEARDSLVDKAQSVASEAIDKVQEVAQKVSGRERVNQRHRRAKFCDEPLIRTWDQNY
jgi:hypothetical protein